MKIKLGVTGTSGAQGAAIARAAGESGHSVKRISRSEGGYDDTTALAKHIAGLDALIVTSPIDHRPGVRQRMMQTISDAAQLAGIQRIVFNPAAAILEGCARPVALNLAALRDILCSGSTPTAVVEPTVYLDNLAASWAMQAIAQGVLPYPAPRQARISWLSHQTLAQCAVAAATQPGITSHSVLRIGGTQALTGDELAQAVGAALGHPVSYVESDLSEFASMLNTVAGAPAGDDIADYYRHLNEHPQALARASNDAQQLGVKPESVASWLARVHPSARPA